MGAKGAAAGGSTAVAQGSATQFATEGTAVWIVYNHL
jgi:hypothetical protein